MPMRVYELAKSLNMSNKDLLERLKKMGIDATNHMNNLNDDDCAAVRNAVSKSKKPADKPQRAARPASDTPASRKNESGDRNQGRSQSRPSSQKNDRQGVAASSFEEYEEAYRSLMAAPVKDMFETYMQRVHSRGELGVLSSLNQRLWREYNDLKSYLETKLKR